MNKQDIIVILLNLSIKAHEESSKVSDGFTYGLYRGEAAAFKMAAEIVEKELT